MITRPKVCGAVVTVAQLHVLFLDDHLHAALVVDDGVLLAVVERSDLAGAISGDELAATFGRLADRAVHPNTPLKVARERMLGTGARRLAVVDDHQRLVGLLCQKANRSGFCSDRDVRARELDRAR